MESFTKEPLYIDDVVVYLKNERTGSSTTRKCKFVGQITGFTKTKVEINRFSPPDVFVTPDKIQDFGTDCVYPDDVVHIIISKHQEDIHAKDIKLLLGKWFSALEDEGVNPWINKECVDIANKYWYTEENYKIYLNTIV